MSEIQDLLNASTQDMVDDYLIIDDNSREIYVPLGELLFGVTNDEKTERKYFQCPRIVGDNVDLTQYQLYINYQNANGEKDKYIVTDVKVVDDNITFTWLLSRKVTEYQGNISFIVCARNVDSLGNITNEWNTAIATGTCVAGLEVDDLTPGEQEQARDYFLQLEQELSALAETENNRLLTTSSNQITNITNKGSEQVQLVENTAKKALDSIPSTYTDLQKQVNEVEDRELKDANGITQELTITDGYAQLTDTATKRLDSLVIKGNTVQNSTKGLNLINCTSKTTTKNGITMVNNGDGTYTVNGTATDDFDIALAPYTTKQNIYYTLSGCPCDTKSELTNGKFPIVIQGIECMVGGCETYGNAFMDIVDATGKREVYIQNDASLLTTNITTAKSTYKKSPYSIQPQKLNTWNYITRIDFDLENGVFVQSNCGQDGSGTAVGFADGVYVDNASSGQKEFLSFGSLNKGSSVGLSSLAASNGVVSVYWDIIARLSINGVRG